MQADIAHILATKSCLSKHKKFKTKVIMAKQEELALPPKLRKMVGTEQNEPNLKFHKLIKIQFVTKKYIYIYSKKT